MLNSVTIMGRLTADPELREVGNGIKMVRVRIACDRDHAKDGKRESDFVNIVAWRGNAEFLAKYFKKGRTVIACGRLESRSWTDKDGNKRSDIEVAVADGGIYFGDSKRPDSNGAPAAPTGYATPPTTPASDFASLEMDDDAQLPF